MLGTSTLRLCKVNFTRYSACTKQLADEKDCSSFKALAIYDTSLEFVIRSA